MKINASSPGKPLITVLVPSYNHARYLRERIQSICSQSCKNIELVVIDDYSADGSDNVIAGLLDEYKFQYIRNAKNSGTPFAAWEQIVTLATGDYIWICESDDIAEPDFLKTAVEALELNRQAALFYCHSWIIDSSGQRIGHTKDYFHKIWKETRWDADFTVDGVSELNNFQLRGQIVPNMSSALIRTQAFRAAYSPFLKKLKLSGDWLFIGDVLRQGPAVFSAQTLNNFRKHADTSRARTNIARQQAEYILTKYKLFRQTDRPVRHFAYLMWTNMLQLAAKYVKRRNVIGAMFRISPRETFGCMGLFCMSALQNPGYLTRYFSRLTQVALPRRFRHFVPDMPTVKQLLPYLRQIDRDGLDTDFGPLARQLENRMTKYLSDSANSRTGQPLALITTSSGFTAISMGLQLLGLPRGAKVLIPALTSPSCPQAIEQMGAEPVLADIDPHIWQLTPEIARAVAAKMAIHAVMPATLYGVPVAADAWEKFIDDTGIPVLINASGDFESQPIPNKALVACNLHAPGSFGIGDGGLLVSHNRELVEQGRCMANFGMQERITIQPGTNGRMSEYHAAVALAQLDRWPGIQQQRHWVYSHYCKEIEEAGVDVVFQSTVNEAVPGFLMLRTAGLSGLIVANGLNALGINAHRESLPPLHRHPYFAGLTVVSAEGEIVTPENKPQRDAFVCERLDQEAFGLPFHTFMDLKEIRRIVKALAIVIKTETEKTAKGIVTWPLKI